MGEEGAAGEGRGKEKMRVGKMQWWGAGGGKERATRENKELVEQKDTGGRAM